MKTQKEMLKNALTLVLGFVFAFSTPAFVLAASVDGWEGGAK